MLIATTCMPPSQVTLGWRNLRTYTLTFVQVTVTFKRLRYIVKVIGYNIPHTPLGVVFWSKVLPGTQQ